jgi:hypothetical protein
MRCFVKRRSLTVAVACCVLGGAALAQEAKAPEITAEQIIEKSIEATGGRAAREKITTHYALSEVELSSGVRGSLTVHAKAPDKRLIVTKLDGYGEMSVVCDGQNAWRKDMSGRVHELSGTDLAAIKREAVMNGDLRWKELYETVELTGKSMVEGREVYSLKLMPKGGGPFLMRHYDAATFLLVRSDLTIEASGQKRVVKTTTSDYRTVDGVNYAHHLVQTNDMGSVNIRVKEIRNNQPIDDALFAKPAPAAAAAPAPAPKQ